MTGSDRIAIGFDVGTSSVKATAITESGQVFSAVSDPYPTTIPFDGAVEQDPDDWWTAFEVAARRLIPQLAAAGARVGPTTTTIGLSGQMHTSVLLGDLGEFVHPALLWSDKRAVDECRELLRIVPDFAAITGNVPMPALTIAHLMWLRRHKPAVFESVQMVLNPKDEMRRRLGAGLATEPADASGTGMFDSRIGVWSSVVAGAAGLDLALFPEVIASHATSGEVTATAALDPSDPLRLLTGVPVVGGGGDQAAQAVALGVTRPGQLGLSLGTSGVAFTATSALRPGSFRHSYDNLWLALDSTHAAGLSLTWLAGLTRSSVAELATTAAGPTDAPLFLPYLQGHRDSAFADGPGAPGAFINLSAHHTRDHLAYSVMEGVAFELTRLAESIGALSAPGSEAGDGVQLGGGGGRSERWRSIIASALDRPIVYSDRDSSFGAAAIAAEAAGWWEAFHAADDSARHVTHPAPTLAAAMAARNAEFKSLNAMLAA